MKNSVLVIIFTIIRLVSTAANTNADQSFLCNNAFNPNSSYVPSSEISDADKVLLQVPLNLEYLEAEFFCWAAFGYGLDVLRPDLVDGGPSPLGTQIAKLDDFTKDVIVQFAYQEIGHIRAIRDTIQKYAIPRPLLNLSKKTWSMVFTQAFGETLDPPFDPYANSINFLLACYTIPYIGLTGYVGTNPNLNSSTAKRLVAGLLAVEAGQDAVIRSYLYKHANDKVHPYWFTVAEATMQISVFFRSFNDRTVGVDDEGIVVPTCLGAEGKIEGNILAGDKYSVGYARNAWEVFAIVYQTGLPYCPGGFYPDGGRGYIAESLLAEQCPS